MTCPHEEIYEECRFGIRAGTLSVIGMGCQKL